MAQYVYQDDAPFAVPPSVSVHYVIEVTNAAVALSAATDLVTTAAHVVPYYVDGNNDEKWPKAIYLGAVNPAADVWATWDGQDPVVGTTAPVGVKLPPTYPALRIPIPAAIKAGTIKFNSDQAGGTPVVICYEF